MSSLVKMLAEMHASRINEFDYGITPENLQRISAVVHKTANGCCTKSDCPTAISETIKSLPS